MGAAGDWTATLVAMVERALAIRGTVLLEVGGDTNLWCAACAAVDGRLELRVGEPSRGWRRWRPAPGEAWLARHDFVHVIDAWSLPTPTGATPRTCAALLEAALSHGLGAPAGASLREVLTHPGVIDADTAPAPAAPHADHIRHALVTLADKRHVRVSIGGGRPEALWAWVWVVEDELLVEPEPPEGQDAEEWKVPLTRQDAVAAAERLTRIFEDHGRDPEDPLFISFIGV